jgi:hypothetical protein
MVYVRGKRVEIPFCNEDATEDIDEGVPPACLLTMTRAEAKLLADLIIHAASHAEGIGHEWARRRAPGRQ